MKPVIIVGSINLDMVYRVRRIPLAGETVLARSLERYAGGKGANQAIAAARMGARVCFVGRVGTDEAAEFMRNSLVQSGVETEAIETSADASTGIALITVSDDGENCIVVNPGANALVDDDQLARHESLLSHAAYCVFQLEIPKKTVFAAIRHCRSLGVKTVLNPSPSAPIPDDVLACVSLLIVNQSEYAYLAGNEVDPVAFVRLKGITDMIITMGAQGLRHVTAQGTRFYPSVPVEAVDTTGAGDCFLGALVAMRAEGRPMDESINIAMKAAAIAVTRPGAQRSMPYRDEVKMIEGKGDGSRASAKY